MYMHIYVYMCVGGYVYPYAVEYIYICFGYILRYIQTPLNFELISRLIAWEFLKASSLLPDQFLFYKYN